MKKHEPVVTPIPSDRLRRCLRSGGVVGLFPLLKGWSKQELRALLKDVKLFHEVSLEKLGRKVEELTKGLSKGKADDVLRAAAKHAYDTLSFKLLVVCSEIDSVAMYYLQEGKKYGE